jgi:NADH-quinone oxidoreductase subunit J
VLTASAWVTEPHAITALASSEGTVENTRALGRVLYTDYFLPFQVSGIILLVAMTGAIVLTLRSRKDARRQKTRRQTGISVADAVEIKKVPTGQGVEL